MRITASIQTLVEEVVAEIRKGSGVLYDSKIVDTSEYLLLDKKIKPYVTRPQYSNKDWLDEMS